MASIFDVAKYILKSQGEMTTMKLQKLTYYCQAWSLVWDDVPLFDEDFEAWSNGPVCRKLYDEHKGKFVIRASYFNDIPDYDFTDNEKETMDRVLDFYGDKDPHWLSEVTHQEFPWKNARKGIPEGAVSDVIIEKEIMQGYYSEL